MEVRQGGLGFHHLQFLCLLIMATSALVTCLSSVELLREREQDLYFPLLLGEVSLEVGEWILLLVLARELGLEAEDLSFLLAALFLPYLCKGGVVICVLRALSNSAGNNNVRQSSFVRDVVSLT